MSAKLRPLIRDDDKHQNSADKNAGPRTVEAPQAGDAGAEVAAGVVEDVYALSVAPWRNRSTSDLPYWKSRADVGAETHLFPFRRGIGDDGVKRHAVAPSFALPLNCCYGA